MKAKNFLDLYRQVFFDKIVENIDIFEWNCPECGNKDIPDNEGHCPSCGYKKAKELYDDKKKYWESIYNKVFSKIKGKLLEDDLKGTNTIKFVSTLSRLGIIRRLKSGRYVEDLKIPREFVIDAFVEGKEGIKRLRRMAWRRKRKQQEYRAKPWQIL